MDYDKELSMLSRKGIAELWATSADTVRRIAKRHKDILREYRIGSQVRYLRQDVQRFTDLMQVQKKG